MTTLSKVFFNDKKVKEIKGYAKAEVKRWFRNKDITEKRNEEIENINDYYSRIIGEETEENNERLKSRFGYTNELLEQRAEIYHEAFWSSFKRYENQRIKDSFVLAKYKEIFNEAEAVAKAVDVSDIRDGFPCGWVTLYLEPEMRKTDLGKAVRNQNDCGSYEAKVCPWSAYKLRLNLPRYGQCIDFDRKVCEAVASFLTSKGIPTGTHSYID